VVPPGVDSQSDSAVVRRAQAEAGAIFIGTVQAVDTLAVNRFWSPSDTAVGRRLMESPDVVRYTFAVSEVWKGRVGRRTRLTVRAFSSDCGREFSLGKDLRRLRAALGSGAGDPCLFTLSIARACDRRPTNIGPEEVAGSRRARQQHLIGGGMRPQKRHGE